MFQDEQQIAERENLSTENLRIISVLNGLKQVENAVNNLTVEEVSIKNFDEVKAHLANELRAVIKAIKSVKFPDTVKVSNFPKTPDINIPDTVKISNLNELEKVFLALQKAVEAIQVNPQVSVNVPDVIVPQITFPDFPKIPPAQVTVEPKVEIDIQAILDALEPLGYLSNKATHPLSVRISDGQKFLEAMKEIVNAQEKQIYAFSQSTGLTKGEYLSAESQLNIGATVTNTYATVGVASGVISTAKDRISITLVNDSDTTIYLAKGSTAVLNSGIRLNASGGSVIICDWRGAISAISSGASKNLTICEVV